MKHYAIIRLFLIEFPYHKNRHNPLNMLLIQMKSKTKKGASIRPRADVHVPECMVWPDPSTKHGKENIQETERVMLKKPELGKTLDRG